MVTGSILRHFSTIELGDAEGKHYTLRNTALTRIALACIGLPHLGFRARARIIFRFLKGVPRSARVLDAGAGYGIYALTLAEKGYTVDAIDVEAERVDALNARKKELPALDERVRARVGSLTALPFEDGAYDVIICSDVIEHIKDDARAVQELDRVLAPGSTLILTVPYDSKNNRRIYKMFGHERPGYSVRDMHKLLAPYALSIERIACYEYALGSILFKVLSAIPSAPIMAALFYPLYVLYLLDMFFKIGEPNGICFKIRKQALVSG